jgi:hypothetical protein
MKRCVDVVGQSMQLTETKEEEAVLVLTVAVSLLSSCGGLLDQAMPQFKGYNEIQRAGILAGVAMVIMSPPGKVPQHRDLNAPEITAMIADIHRMFAREIPHGFDQRQR